MNVGTFQGFNGRSPQFHFRFLYSFGEKSRSLFFINERVHGLESFEGILAVEDTGPVEFSAFCLQDAASKAAIDRCAADQHRDVMPAALQLVDNERHLL